MRNIFILIVVIIPQFVIAQNYLTKDIITRVFHLKYNDATGTTFLIDKDSINYFVIAKHILQNPLYGQKMTVEIFQGDSWKILTGDVFFDTSKNVDFVLLRPDNLDYVSSGISLKNISMILGDEGFFMGFPYGLSTLDKGNINAGFPFPLIKKAIYSGSLTDNGVFILLLDGHNNPGFSGGPILFKDRLKTGDDKYHLVGVVSAYVNQHNELVTPFGKLKYQENSGIIIGYGRKHIEEIIEGIKTP